MRKYIVDIVAVLAMILFSGPSVAAGEPECSELNAYVDGTVWEIVETIDKDKGVYHALKYYLDGTEIIEGKEYLKMYSERSIKKLSNNHILKSEAYPTYIGGIRNIGGKIFFAPQKLFEEYLVFDYSIQPDQEVVIYPYLCSANPIPISECIKCLGIDELMIGDKVIKLIKVMNGRDTHWFGLCQWKGGISTSRGPLSPIYAEDSRGLTPYLRMVKINGKIVYQCSVE